MAEEWIRAGDAEVGHSYISKKGIKCKVLEKRKDKVKVKTIGTEKDIETELPSDYRFKVLDPETKKTKASEDEPSKEKKDVKSSKKEKAVKKSHDGKSKSLFDRPFNYKRLKLKDVKKSPFPLPSGFTLKEGIGGKFHLFKHGKNACHTLKDAGNGKISMRKWFGKSRAYTKAEFTSTVKEI